MPGKTSELRGNIPAQIEANYRPTSIEANYVPRKLRRIIARRKLKPLTARRKLRPILARRKLRPITARRKLRPIITRRKLRAIPALPHVKHTAQLLPDSNTLRKRRSIGRTHVGSQKSRTRIVRCRGSGGSGGRSPPGRLHVIFESESARQNFA
jgi:hypothetical protein